MKAVVTQEGRFLVARLADGSDVSNQIDRDIRRKAVELGVECIYTDGEWSVPGYSKPAGSFSFAKAQMPEPEIIEIVEPDAGHKEVTDFIHKSVGLKPQSLIMNDLKDTSNVSVFV